LLSLLPEHRCGRRWEPAPLSRTPRSSTCPGYGVPTVIAAGVATQVIADGDKIQVDGTNGKVTIFEKAGAVAGEKR
jgi:hypothetical protein